MRLAVSLLAIAGLLTLSACDWFKKKDEVQPLNNVEDVVVNNAAENVAEAAPVSEEPEPANVTNIVKAPPPPELSQDQQTMDDADATGLTSRLPEDDVATVNAAR